MTRPLGRRITVIIPAHNEEDRIAATIQAVQGIEGVEEIVVIDDGSTDDTACVATASGATSVLRHGRNRGKGEAMKTGLAVASCDILLYVDADLGVSACEADRLLDPILEGRADVALATFPSTAGGGVGLAVGLARWGIHRLTGVRLSAPLSGQRAMSRAVAESIGSFAPGYSVETAMTIDLLRAGYRIEEVQTGMTHRTTGRDLHGFRHRGQQFLHIARALLSRAFDGGRMPR